MAEALTQLTALLNETKQPANPLRHHQVREYREEARRLGGIVQQTDSDGRPGQSWIGGDPEKAARRVRQIHDILSTQAPQPLTGERQNRALALTDAVIAEEIQPQMLSRTIMRRNPAGAVGHFRRHEGSAAFKRAALAVKRAIRAVDPENDDPDLTNLERFRPEGSAQDGTSTFMANATIPGFLAMSPQAKDNWEASGLGEPTIDTALKQAQRAERDLKRERRDRDRARSREYAARKRAEKKALANGGAQPTPVEA